MNLDVGQPWMLWGGLLVGVPILIHLLNRRRFRIVPFAALRFLEQAYAQRRRRLRSESLLLLLLRCLIVLLAALAMSLPFVPQDSLLAALTGGRRELVLVVDRSASLGRLLAPGLTLDDRVLERVRRRLDALSDERGDSVTLITPGAGNSLPAPIGAPPSVVLAALDQGLALPAGTADMVATTRLIAERVRPVRQGRLEVEVYTDLQALSWDVAGASLGALFAAALEPGGGSLRLIDVAAELPLAQNLGVEALSVEEGLVLAGRPLGLSATLRNHGAAAMIGVEGGFRIDGELAERVRVDLPPGGTTAVTLRRRLDRPGAHHIAFALQGDVLPFDDERTLALQAGRAVDVLLVDGSPGGAGEQRLEGATGYLELALRPPGGDDAPGAFRAQVVDLGRFEEDTESLLDTDAVVLAGVGALSEAAATALGDAVRGGVPLLAFIGGDGLDAGLWNRHLDDERLGTAGLLPAEIGGLRGDPGGTGAQDYVTLALPNPAPPALALFDDARLAVLLQVPTLAWVELVPAPESRVLALWADAAGSTSPALVEGRFGRGRVVLVGTTANADWTLLPRQPETFVPLVHELLAALVAPDPADTNVPVGQSVALVVDGVPSRATLQDPAGGMTTVEQPQATRIGRTGGRHLLALDALPLEQAGAWLLTVTSAGAAESEISVALAAQPDAREGDLARVDAGTLQRVLSGVEFTLGETEEGEEADAGASRGDGSLVQALLWTLLAVALAESVLARFMGVSR